MSPLRACPGCNLEMPAGEQVYDRKFNASAELQSPALFARAHQLTVDAYAVQHAGGRHPDKSVCVHLAGLGLYSRGISRWPTSRLGCRSSPGGS